MKRNVRQALKLLRASAAAEGFRLDHLSDDDLLAGVAAICRSYVVEGRAPALISVGHQRMGFAFGDLWTAANLDRDLSFYGALRGEAAAE